MSMENAILELAAAIRYAADRNNGIGQVLALTTERIGLADKADTELDGAELDAEMHQAVEKVEAAAKEEKKAPAKAEPKADEPATTLDYKADVYPKLVALAKAKGKPSLVGLLKEFDAANGDALKAEQYSAVVARAAQLAA